MARALRRGMKLHLAILLTSVSFLGVVGMARAEDEPATSPPVMLGTIVIFGSGEGSEDRERNFRFPASVYTVTGESIERTGACKTDDLLRTIPGAFTQSQARTPGISVNLRGMQDFGRSNVMIDGARQTFQYTTAGVMGTAYVDPALLGRVDVQKGLITGVGGAGALGGAVNFRTLSLDDILIDGRDSGSEAVLTYGGNGYDWSGRLATGFRYGRMSVLGAFSSRDSGQYKDGDGNFTDQTGQRTSSGLLKFGFDIDETQNLELGLMSYDSDFSLMSAHFNADVLTFTGKYRNTPGNDLVDLSINTYYNRTKVNQLWFASLIHGEDITYNNESIGFDATNISRFSLGEIAFTARYGVEAFRDKVRTVDIGSDQSAIGWTPSGERAIVGAFAELTGSHGIFDLTLAARLDHFSLSGSGNNPTTGTSVMPDVPAGPFTVDRSETAFSPKITLAARPADWLQVYASYGEGFRPPAVTESLMSSRHPGFVGNFVRFFPNPFLEPERSTGWEVGTNFAFDNAFTDGDRIRVKAAWHDSDIENYIVAGQGSCMAATCFFFRNTPGTSNVAGFELDASYDAGRFFTELGYHNIKADLPVPSSGLGSFSGPPKEVWTLTAGVRLMDERLVLGGRIRDVSESVYPGQASSGAPSAPIAAYRLYDAFASWKISEQAEINLTAENLTNETYTPGMSVDLIKGPGRTVKISLGMRF